MLGTVLTVLGVVLLAVFAVVAVVAGRAWWVTRVARRRLRELGGHQEVAVLLGHASAGRDQRPRVGSIVRTADAVVFVPVAAGSEGEISVDRSEITSTSTTRSFMGRTYPEPGLLLTWERLGLGDAMVVKVGDPEAWVEALRP